MLKIIFFAFLIASSSLQASSYSKYELDDEKNYADYEKSIETQIRDQNFNDQQKFDIYSWAITKMENVNIRGFRKKYLKKILKLKTTNDKKPYLLKLADLYYQEGNFPQLANIMEKYLKDQNVSSLTGKNLFYTLAVSKKLSTDFFTSAQIGKLHREDFQLLLQRHDINVFVKQKKWNKAFGVSKRLTKSSLQDQLNHLYLAKVTKNKTLPQYCKVKESLPLIKKTCKLLNSSNKLHLKKNFISLKSIFPEFKTAQVILEHVMEGK